jgi:hypothetical protein
MTAPKYLAEVRALVAEARKYGPLLKAEHQGQADARDAVRRCNNFETVIGNLEKRFDALATVREAIDWQGMSRRVFELEHDVRNLKLNVPSLHNDLEGRVKALAAEVEELQSAEDNRLPWYAGGPCHPVEFVHGCGCSKEGDDVRRSCPECEPVPKQAKARTLHIDPNKITCRADIDKLRGYQPDRIVFHPGNLSAVLVPYLWETLGPMTADGAQVVEAGQ